MVRKQIPSEALIDLHRRLSMLPARSSDRRTIICQTADLYGVSQWALYRALRAHARPKALRRADRGLPRVLPREKMEYYCEVIAAIKVRTSNKKGRHLSTAQAIRLLEEYGIETPDGLVKAPRCVLRVATINRYLKQWGYDRATLSKQSPAVRFQARYSNECWHFDLSPSDLKEIKPPLWAEQEKGRLVLMLYSVVDDRSGVAYQEYHCVYGEDVEAALRFLFNAMSPKKVEGFAFQGIPQMIYTDNGPIAKSHLFLQVMKYLGVNIQTHLPQSKDGRRTTARAKGKVERPFRTVKEMHETLYHFHEPKDELEANAWLMQFLLRYNDMEHRYEAHSRLQDWIENLPSTGIKQMCGWERFCTFAREPERRKVGADARVQVEGIFYQVDPNLAGEEVILWWGIFDNELYVEHGEHRYGPYVPVAGPIPLHRYRAFKKTKWERRAERIETLAEQLSLPRAALEGNTDLQLLAEQTPLPIEQPFIDPDPFQEFSFPNALAAKRSIAEHLGTPLAKLHIDQLEKIDQILAETLNKVEVMERVQNILKSSSQR